MGCALSTERVPRSEGWRTFGGPSWESMLSASRSARFGFQWASLPLAGGQFWEPTCSGLPERCPTAAEGCCRWEVLVAVLTGVTVPDCCSFTTYRVWPSGVIAIATDRAIPVRPARR